MRTLKLIVLFILVSLNCKAFEKDNSFLNFKIDQTDFVDTIPVDFKNGQILIPVVCNNMTCHFCLDTGSGCGILNLPTDIHYYNTGVKVIISDANNSEGNKVLTRIPYMRVGKVGIENYPVLLSSNETLSCLNDGVIGFNLLRKGLLLKIDIASKQIIITDKKNFFKNEKGISSHYKSLDVPLVVFNMSYGKSDYAVFDTGRSSFFDMNKKEIYDFNVNPKNNPQYRQFLDQTIWEGFGYGAISINNVAESACSFMKLKALNIFGLSFADVPSTATNGFCGIGTEVLKYGSVIINPFNHKIIFQPYGADKEINLDKAPINMVVSVKDGRPFISMINPHCKLFKDGARTGDVIVGLYGIAVNDYCTFLNTYYSKSINKTIKLKDAQGNLKVLIL